MAESHLNIVQVKRALRASHLDEDGEMLISCENEDEEITTSIWLTRREIEELNRHLEHELNKGD